ncbi:ankyrin repeat domain-containing protein [Undibacterium sp. 5I1]|uniref:ankyrin repeat domain-containing protein n=1 Tax=unclassified Undibacterium TaxID=2630295 RepID=UPI002AB4417A|nr:MULTISPECIES: ankyrin repeat domain-containing protein [unclassified Undibacterium]MDY7540790.1 ankyrin repeat domain-containing protein [Undibacterium sp. 5I1]MEB0233141.1 ankyrin repeat domain-containing protein [Undibacterium sp. 10I3]MEB0259887.1 ankyrin repeat domain-containing protein [Undibacterium sp. 5I1]
MKNLDEVLKAVGSTAEFLFQGASNVHQRGCFGDTPLHIVCSWGDVEAVDTLILAGADVNARGEQGQTSLFSAVMGRSIEVVRKLIDADVDLTIEDEDGNTALQFAQMLDEPDKPIPVDLIELLRNSKRSPG